jgi:hypothetical protein
MVTIASELTGFVTQQRSVTFDQQPRQVDFQLAVAAVSETVTVTADAPQVNTSRGMTTAEQNASRQAPSQNVINLQRRVAGVLPVRVDVPRTGTAHQFVKPLVLDEPARVSFKYKAR